MSAKVEAEVIYYAFCVECRAEKASCKNEEDAEEWAANHDAEHHETDTSDDEKYERFKEARYGS